jgi:hypothetical protein
VPKLSIVPRRIAAKAQGCQRRLLHLERSPAAKCRGTHLLLGIMLPELPLRLHREVEKPDREQDAISSLPIRMGGREKHNRCSLIPLSEQEVFRSLCALAIPQGGLHLCRRGRKRNTSVVIRSRHVAERSPILQGSTRRHSRDHTRTR